MKPVSFDGNNINDGTNYDSIVLETAYGLPDVRPVVGARQGRWPLLGAVGRPGREIYVDIIIRGASVGTLQKQLNQWFDPEDEDPKQFIVEDDAGGNNRYVNAICRSLTPVRDGGGIEWIASLVIHGDVRFREVTPTTPAAWNITATGQTNNFTNNGQDDAYPIIKIKPTSAKTSNGYAHKRFIPVRWRVSEAASDYPVDIVNDGFDTAALVTAGKMQADGDDLRVYVDGNEVDRWLDGINTTTTKVWVNLDFQSAQDDILLNNIGAADTTIDVRGDISSFPSSGILMVDSEAITYTGKSNSLKRFTGCTRGAKGTTAATHTSGAVIFWVQHEIWILYGNSGATAPTVDDSYKPVFSLVNSTNGSWDFDDFYVNDGLRAGDWDGRQYISGSPSFYGGNRGASANPWVEIGVQINEATAQNQTGALYFYNPCGFTAANFVGGEKYTDNPGLGADSWDGSLDSSEDGTTWTERYAIPAPSAAATWQAWSQNLTGLPPATKYVRLYMSCVKSVAVNGRVQRAEAADVTVTLASGNTPTITIGAEQTNYSLDAIITNNTTGLAIKVTAQITLNQELEVDTDEKTLAYLLDNSNQFQALDLQGAARRDWLALQPGVNQLQFDDTGTAAVTMTLEWEERHYQ